MYNVLEARVKKGPDGLCIPLSDDITKLLKVEEDTDITLTFRKKCVELRSVNYVLGQSSFDNLESGGDILARFGRHFGGRDGSEVFIAEKDYLCLFNNMRIVALMKYNHAANDWLSGYNTVYRKLKELDRDELQENKLFVLCLKGGIPKYVADDFITYHAILVLEAMLIMGKGAQVFYPEEGAYPLVVTDEKKNWCVLIRPRVNWEQAPPGVERPDLKEEEVEGGVGGGDVSAPADAGAEDSAPPPADGEEEEEDEEEGEGVPVEEGDGDGDAEGKEEIEEEQEQGEEQEPEDDVEKEEPESGGDSGGEEKEQDEDGEGETLVIPEEDDSPED